MTDSLTHYSSDNYDPAKAHEYYMRNRDLKGGGKKAPTTQKQREGISYAKKTLGDKKKAETKFASEAHKARMVQMRANADASRKRIEKSLDALLDKIRAKAVVAPRKIVKKVPLNEIPANASPERRAYLEKQNATISKTNKAAQDKADAEYAARKAVADKAASSQMKAAKEAARTEMRKVGTDLKAAVKSARESYSKATKQRDTKYKTAVETEEKNIKANVR